MCVRGLVCAGARARVRGRGCACSNIGTARAFFKLQFITIWLQKVTIRRGLLYFN